MALTQPPIFFGLASHQYSASRVRRLIQKILHDVDGVAAAGHLAANPTTPTSMSVTIAPGGAFVTGTTVAGQGVYLVENDDPVQVGPFNPVVSGARVDLVALRIRDGAPDGGSDPADSATIEIVEGTAAATPTAPAVPPSSLVLAQIRVAAGDTGISKTAISGRPQVAGAPMHTLTATRQGGDITVAASPGWSQVTYFAAGDIPPGRWVGHFDVNIAGTGSTTGFVRLRVVNPLVPSLSTEVRYPVPYGGAVTYGIDFTANTGVGQNITLDVQLDGSGQLTVSDASVVSRAILQRALY